MKPALTMSDDQRLEARKDRLRTVCKLNNLPLDTLTKQALDGILEEQKPKDA